MKLATIRTNNRSAVALITSDDAVVDLAAAAEAASGPALFGDMLTFLESGDEGLALAAQLADGADTMSLDDVTLCAPVPQPGKLLCIAGNFVAHIEESARAIAPQDKETPRFFMKPSNNTVIACHEAIRIPPVAREIDWEGELAVVIGRTAKGVKRDVALDYVAGYTIMNDVSERSLQIWDRSESRPMDLWFDWLNGKWLDTSAPQGPWIVTTDELTDPQDVEISTYINGERKQHCSTAQMIFPVANLIEYITSIVTLSPGDLISTGTVAGVGNATGDFMQPGDKVKISITGIGDLHNTVEASDV